MATSPVKYFGKTGQTYCTRYNPAILAEDSETAKAYLEYLVSTAMLDQGVCHATAEAQERANVIMWSADYSPETRERVLRLYGHHQQVH